MLAPWIFEHFGKRAHVPEYGLWSLVLSIVHLNHPRPLHKPGGHVAFHANQLKPERNVEVAALLAGMRRRSSSS